jgi:transcriptional regulator with XRE-family HTH domain
MPPVTENKELFARLMLAHGYSQREVAEAVGLSRYRIAKILSQYLKKGGTREQRN